ncbi:MAG: hypothetical protein GMKNLPBB_01010 [Myxococcota bacterium]|nr:hypothetical protein [Myxococcota bacterium]
MKPRPIHPWTAIAIGVFAWGCGVPFPLDVVIENEVAFAIDTGVQQLSYELGRPFPDPYPNNSTYPPLDRSVSVVVSKEIRLSDKPDIQSNRDKIREIRLDRLEFEVLENTLSQDLTQLELFMAPPGADQVDDGRARLVTVIPRIPAGALISGGLEFAAENRDAVRGYLRGLDFAILSRGRTQLDTLRNNERPKGGVRILVTIRSTFITEPLGGGGEGE